MRAYSRARLSVSRLCDLQGALVAKVFHERLVRFLAWYASDGRELLRHLAESVLKSVKNMAKKGVFRTFP